MDNGIAKDLSVSQTRDVTGSIDLAASHQLERGLKSRHVQFIALGGAIGTGLFVGSGGILSTVGPAPLFMAYITMIFVVWVVMNDLAEMATYLPLKGISVPYFVERFVEPSLAFADGWNYWYAYAILVAAEATAGAIVLQYWTKAVPVAVWITVILLSILALNIFAISIFGEAEFWAASIKLITIIGLVILSIVLFFGGGPSHDNLGFRYWSPHNPGAFAPYLASSTNTTTSRFLAYWTATIRAGFAFILSPELLAVAAGEAIAPRRNLPKAARRYIYRLALFYGFGSLAIGILVPHDDSRLLSPDSNASASPFVSLTSPPVKQYGSPLTSSPWIAGNAFLYSGSRTLYSLSLSHQAPRIFSRTTSRGVPYAAVLATWLVACLAYLNVSNSGAKVFIWFSNISTISGFIAWIVAMITYLRFRKAMQCKGLLYTLPYRTPLQPYATYFVLGLVTILTLTNGFPVFFPEDWNISDFLAAHITLPVFLVLYLGHKIWLSVRRVEETQKSSWTGGFWTFARKVEDVDVVTGKREMDEMEALDIPPVPRNWVEKVWFWLA
ncbi:hypothetical protein B0A54_10396 [Friedmanniomyces endolithicus]|uniref:Amino acid permease/ SLC12A domain-containing protein n=1 Tax=Friedmanniomyces endolithicus TaxID=329885 RepID=A0A4U0UTR5_9PEZI|nr:hypothetical protein B0A54_10396 [Friedmanniomyces endolithicus]